MSSLEVKFNREVEVFWGTVITIFIPKVMILSMEEKSS